jgi:nitronate monooxygenase
MDDQKSLDSKSARGRAMAFCQRYGLRIPILLAPMAGSCPVSLSVAVAGAGGMGAMGALLSSPDAIANWAAEFRSRSLGPFQLNLWIAQPAPMRDFAAEQRVREFLSSWGQRFQPRPVESNFRILRSNVSQLSPSDPPLFLRSWVCIPRHLSQS